MSRRKQRFPFHLTGDECAGSVGTNTAISENSVCQHKMDAQHKRRSTTPKEDYMSNDSCTNPIRSRHDSSPFDDSNYSQRDACSPLEGEVLNLRKNSPNNDKEINHSDEESSAEQDIILKCPVCHLKFESISPFNSHVYEHCQEAPLSSSLKREGYDESSSAKRLRTSNSFPSHAKATRDCHSDSETYLPLDLSYHPQHGEEVSKIHSNLKQLPQSFEMSDNICQENGSNMSTEENLLNEACEPEKSFFNSSNELYLTEDSTGFDASPLLPVYQSGGAVRQITVCGEEGSPMVYQIKLHSEQMLVSRILGVNQETGNKIELYKCYLCNLSFVSISRLQAHLIYHKQKFICKMCNYSCDTRALFAYHLQKQHLVKCENKNTQLDYSEDSTSAENSVTVAALLSALRENSVDKCNRSETTTIHLEDDGKSESVSPISPSSESQESMEGRENGDNYKGYSCRYCNKRFDRAFSCNRHERVHTGYKPCYCRFCGRGFSEPRNLRHHVIRFHSDGSLRHLIKRDRKKRREEELENSSLPLLKTVLQSANESDVSNFVNNLDTVNFNMNARYDVAPDQKPINIEEGSDFRQNSTIENYAKSLTKMLTSSIDGKTKLKTGDNPVNSGDSLRSNHGENNNELEPGEIRFKIGTKVIDDGERGRRLVMTEENSEDVMEHSPQFSSYAPRLHIVQDRINRDKALTPITDDIGRTFYECPYCRKLFGSTSDLNRHLDFHEDLRPYDCDYCNYSARTNSQLKVHKMRHEGIKQYTCDVCNYNGVTQSDLNRHKKTQSHTARSQNICSVCGLGFYSHSQKQVHIVQCHPEMEGASSLIQMSLGVPLSCKESTNSSDALHPPSELISLAN